MDGPREIPSSSSVRHIADHPVSRHRKADPALQISTQQAEEIGRRYAWGPLSPEDAEKRWASVRSGEEYRDMPIYNFRPPVPLEELWFVAVGGPYYQIDGPSLHVGISKRTGEVLWANWVTEGG